MRLLSRTLVLTGISRIISALGGLGFTIVIGRLFGAEALGTFVFANTIVLLLVMIAKFGGDRDLIKFSAVHPGPEWSSSRQSRLGSYYLISGAIAVSAIAALSILPSYSDRLTPERTATLAALSLVIPLMSWMWLNAGFIKGLSYPHIGTLFENGGVFAMSALILLGAASFGVASTMTGLVNSYIIGAGAAWALSLCIALWLNQRSRKPKDDRDLKAGHTRTNLQFVMLDVTNFLMTSGAFIVGGLLLIDEDLGVLRGAERSALLIAFVISVTNVIVAPKIARNFARNDREALRKTGRWAVTINTIFATPLLMVCLIYPQIFTMIFGADFDGIEQPLRIMATAQFFNVIAGPCGVFLAMTAHANTALKINVGVMILSMMLYVILITSLGPIGFALAYCLSLFIKNLVMLGAVRKYLGFWYLPGFPAPSPR